MSLQTRLSFIRAGMNVRRYHQQPTLEVDTVGKHSCGVALLAQMIHPMCSKNVLLVALSHDLGESVLGDIPSPAKKLLSKDARDQLDEIELSALRSNDFDFPLYDEDVVLLKICDMLDGLAFCCEELHRGNRSIAPIAENYMNYLGDYINSNRDRAWINRADSLYATLVKTWSNSYVR